MERGEDARGRTPHGRGRMAGRLPGERMPVRSLAAKLQLTRLALGCSTQKELVARFAAVNPATAFTAQNAYKWLGGKAMPRVSSVYEDWAQILGGRLAAPFIAACSFEEFAEALRERFDIPEAALRAVRVEASFPVGSAARDLEGAPPAGNGGSAPNGAADGAYRLDLLGRPDTGRGGLLLEGTFMALSRAWSRTQEGRLVLGAARIAGRSEGGLGIDYMERVLGRRVPFTGPVFADSHAVQAVLDCRPTGRFYFLALQFPAFPANVIGGLLCGTVLHDPEVRSVCSRFVLVRNHALGWEELQARCGYVDADAGTLGRELGALGYVGGVENAAGGLTGFLSSSAEMVEVGGPDIGILGHALDLLATDEA